MQLFQVADKLAPICIKTTSYERKELQYRGEDPVFERVPMIVGLLSDICLFIEHI